MFVINENPIDSGKETEGVWIDAEQGLRLKIARFKNPEYRRTLRKLSKPSLRTIRKEDDKAFDIMDEISRKVAAKTILKGWENLQEKVNGELVDVPYSPEKALEYFNAYEDFYEMVIEYSQDMSYFTKEDAEDAEGN